MREIIAANPTTGTVIFKLKNDPVFTGYVINMVIEEDGVVTYPNPTYDFFSNYDFSYWDPMGERNFWKLGSYLGKDAVDNYPGIVQFDTIDYNVA